MARFNWKFLGYPARRIKDEIIRRMCVSFTASDGAVVNYRGKDELSGKLQYRGATRGDGVQKPFNYNEHLSSDITGENSISNIIAVQDKYGLLSAVGLHSCLMCSSMVSVYLPKIIDVKGYAFEQCSSLTSIHAPNTLSIGSSAFANCIKLQEANFPNVESIDRIAFYRCKQLGYVDIRNIENLEKDQQFSECTMLSAIDMENVKSIGTWSFIKCKSLKCINTPKLISIGNRSFEGCTSISSVIIPNVSSFGDQTFQECQNLKNIYLSNQDIPPTTGEDILSDITSKPTIWVKNETYKKYLTADYWKTEDISGHISSITQPTVTFLCGESVLKTEKLNYNMSAEAPVISRPYYIFKGWDNSYVDVIQDVSCTAIWGKYQINDATTRLNMTDCNQEGTESSYNHNGQPCTDQNPVVYFTKDDGTEIILENTRDYTNTYGNNIVDWTDIAVGETREQTAQISVVGTGEYEGTVTTDFKITYTRTSSKVTVTFNPCGGDIEGKEPKTPQTIEYNTGDQYGTLPVASKVGSALIGWFTEEEGGVEINPTDTVPDTASTVYAHWQTNKFGLSAFTDPSDHGTVNGATSVFISNDIPWNSTITLSAVPDTGFEWVKWSDENTLSTRELVITQDTTLTANFRYIIYTLTTEIVPQNVGTTSNPTGVRYNDGVWLSARPNEGYEFSRWNTDDSVFQIEKKTEISTLGSLKQTTSTSISAVFTPITYTITYNTDGGTATQNLTSYTIESETITLLNDTTKENYEFLGWYDEDGNKITEITKGSTGNKSLKAKWEPHVVLTYDTGYEDSKTITINTNIDKSTNIEYDTFDDLLD